MFSAFAKITKRIALYPKAIIGVLLTLALLCLYPINNLRWELQLQDSLKGNEVQADYQDIENAFGGLGSLTIVLQSDDSLKNLEQAQRFAQKFSKDSLIHFIEYTADVEFFKKNRLLYASENDIESVVNLIDSIRLQQAKENNPLLVDLLSQPSSSIDSASTSDALQTSSDVPAQKAENSKAPAPDSSVPTSIISQIEEKYFRNLQQNYANENGTIRVIDIYPTNSLTNLQANRALYQRVSAYFDETAVPAGINVYYTGKVFDSIKVGRTLLPEAKFAGKMAAIILLILMVLHFYRQPQLIIISALPVALPTVFMFGIAYLLFGRICLFTLPLALLLPGHASQILTHVLTRYFHEREQNLSPALCVESAILGIGPAVAASSLIIAALFLSLIVVPLPGLKEFAILGCIGSLLNLYICPLLATSLLQFTQRKKPFNINPIARHTLRRIKLFPNKVNWIIIATISIVSSIGWLYSGSNLSFIYDFRQTELQLEEQKVQDLIHETGFSTYDPIIILLPDSSYNDDILANFEHLQSRDQIPDLKGIYTQYQFLPKMTQGKRSLIERLQKELSPQILSSMGTQDSAAIVEMLNNYENDIKEFELSEGIRRKFSDKNGNSGRFVFIIPATDPNNGLTCRHINAQLEKIEGIQDNKFKFCGTPILRANVLDIVLSNVDKSLILGTILLWLVLLMYYNKLSRAFFTMLPSIFSMSWLTILIYGWGIHISFYSSLAFVLLIGASVDGSLQLWSSYYEKQGGSAWTVLQTKISSVLTAQGASFIGSIAMLLSSHPGIKSMGIILIIGLICIFISQLTIYPLIASTLDAYRVIKKRRLRNESSLQ